VIIITTTGSAENPKPHAFTNFDEKTSSMPVWKVACATTAAPGFFRHFYDKDEDGLVHIDGGLVSNNPTTNMIDAIDNFSNGEVSIS
jgi:patatin-like phospholipase/acyl hydrolase